MFPINILRRIAPKHLFADLVVIVSSSIVALVLQAPRFSDGLAAGFSSNIGPILTYVALTAALRLTCMIAFGCYSVMWRYISTVDAIHIAKAVGLSSIINIAATHFVVPLFGRSVPLAVHFVDGMAAMVLLLGARLARRLLYEGQANRLTRSGKRTLLYGAGENGRSLAHRFKSDAYLDTNVVGYIDDDPTKCDLVIQGVPVLGTREVLQHVIEKFNISQVIVSISNVSGQTLRELVMATRPFNIKPRVIQPTSDRNRQQIEIYREVELQDLLNRIPIQVDLSSVSEMVRGRVVLITGAGGSIGSELARQIAVHEPSRLLLLDSSEFNLYEVDRELRLSTHDVQRIVPLLVDLKDQDSLRHVIQEYKPEVVLHAAAYKHVHLVEANPCSAVINNIGGTKNLLELCRESKVDTFVMISTDKAVNPAGVMGATKRVCELMVTATAIETGRRYVSVRFGNVLGSSGSLIPLLKKQIKTGGPVTVTHPDMTRFFMLIPEAVSLVLKAATIAKPGDINVLKMGEPVRILDIARSLIALMGRTENDVPIVFTGLRPGEKMFEELYLRGDELQTEHPDILTLPNGDSPLASSKDEMELLSTSVDLMLKEAEAGSPKTLKVLNELVKSTYIPSPDERKDNGQLRIHQ